MGLFSGVGKLFSGATKLVGGIVGDLLGVEKPKAVTPPPEPTLDAAQNAAEEERRRLKSQAGYSSTLSGGLLSGQSQSVGSGGAGTKAMLGS